MRRFGYWPNPGREGSTVQVYRYREAGSCGRWSCSRCVGRDNSKKCRDVGFFGQQKVLQEVRELVGRTEVRKVGLLVEGKGEVRKFAGRTRGDFSK